MPPAGLGLALVAVLAAASPSATVRADGPALGAGARRHHQGFSRVVFNFSTRTDYSVTRQGDRVAVPVRRQRDHRRRECHPAQRGIDHRGQPAGGHRRRSQGRRSATGGPATCVVIDIAEPDAAADAKPPPQRPARRRKPPPDKARRRQRCPTGAPPVGRAADTRRPAPPHRQTTARPQPPPPPPPPAPHPGRQRRRSVRSLIPCRRPRSVSETVLEPPPVLPRHRPEPTSAADAGADTAVRSRQPVR